MLAPADAPAALLQLLTSAVGWLKEERPTADVNIMMVVGVPNCGKSSIINALKVSAKSQGM